VNSRQVVAGRGSPADRAQQGAEKLNRINRRSFHIDIVLNQYHAGNAVKCFESILIVTSEKSSIDMTIKPFWHHVFFKKAGIIKLFSTICT